MRSVTGRVIETRTQFIWLGEDGILRSKCKPNAELSLEDAKAAIAEVSILCNGIARPILVDLAGTKSIHRDARNYFAGPETIEVECAAALLVGSPIARAIGNFFIGINKATVPSRLFTSEQEALDWLQQFLPEARETREPDRAEVARRSR